MNKEQQAPDNKVTLGKTLSKARTKMKLTLRQVEEAVGVSNAYLSQLENDKINNPSANVLYKLANFYKVDMERLLYGIVSSPIIKHNHQVDEDEEEELIRYLEYLRSKKQQLPSPPQQFSSDKVSQLGKTPSWDEIMADGGLGDMGYTNSKPQPSQLGDGHHHETGRIEDVPNYISQLPEQGKYETISKMYDQVVDENLNLKKELAALKSKPPDGWSDEQVNKLLGNWMGELLLTHLKDNIHGKVNLTELAAKFHEYKSKQLNKI